MSTTREEVLKTALELSEADRLLLATELMDTVANDPPGWSLDDPELPAEIEARVNDGSPGIPWEAVKAQLRADLEA